MTLDHLTAAATRVEDRLMVDTCQITAPGDEVYDPATDTFTTTGGAVRYDGKCFVNTAAVPTKPGEFAGAQVQIDVFRARVPREVTTIQEGDIFTVTASRDPNLVGAAFDVADVRHSTFDVTRMLQLRRRQRTHPIV